MSLAKTEYILISDIDYDDGVWGYASEMPQHPKVIKYYAYSKDGKNHISSNLISKNKLAKGSSTHFTLSQVIEMQKLVFNCLGTPSPMALNAPSQSFARQNGMQGMVSPFIPVPVNLITTVPKQAIRDLLISENGIEQAMFGGEFPIDIDEWHMVINDDIINYMKKHIKHPRLISDQKKEAIRKQWKPTDKDTKEAIKKLHDFSDKLRNLTVPLVKNRITRDTNFLINADKIYKKNKPEFISWDKYIQHKTDEWNDDVYDDIDKYIKENIKHPHLISKKKKQAVRKQWKPTNQATKNALNKLRIYNHKSKEIVKPFVKSRIKYNIKLLVKVIKNYESRIPNFMKNSKYLLIHKYNESNHTYNIITNSNVGKIPIKSKNVTKDDLSSQPSFSYHQIVKLRKHIFKTGKYDDEAKVQPKHDYRNYEFVIVPVSEINLVTPQRIQFILKDETNRTGYNFVNSDQLTVQEWLVANSKMLIRYQIPRNNIQLHEKITNNDIKNLPSVYNYNFGYDNG